MIELKTPREIELMAAPGRFVADTLTELSRLIEPGINLMAIEKRARRLIADAGAESCYWDYSPSFGSGPFRNVICLSVNDAVLHGKPHNLVVSDGDVVSLDFAVSLGGWVADSAITVIAGEGTEADRRLVASTAAGLEAGIAAAVPGARIGDISSAIGAVADMHGYPVSTEFGGHGLGRTMHEDPAIPNDGRAGRGMVLREGMTFAIEPWWSASSRTLTVDPDGWTLRFADGSNGSHAEHTIAVTADGPRVLTARS